MTQRHKIGGKWAKGVSRKNASVEVRFLFFSFFFFFFLFKLN